MKFRLDEYAHLNSPLHRWEPRLKLIGLLLLIFAFSFVRTLWLLPPMLLVTAILFALSQLPISYLMERLKLPGVFLLALAVLLPFSAGQTVLLDIGPLALREEGVLSLILIACRFVSIITVSLILFGTAYFLTTIKAMRALGFPDLLADMTLLTYRYLFEIADHFSTMRRALQLRGFDGHRFTRRNLITLSSLIGSLLVRSYEQSERVYQAMILRGYGNRKPKPDEFQTQLSDWLWLSGVTLIAAGFVVGQLYL